jgi:hypothetical protein
MVRFPCMRGSHADRLIFQEPYNCSFGSRVVDQAKYRSGFREGSGHDGVRASNESFQLDQLHLCRGPCVGLRPVRARPSPSIRSRRVLPMRSVRGTAREGRRLQEHLRLVRLRDKSAQCTKGRGPRRRRFATISWHTLIDSWHTHAPHRPSAAWEKATQETRPPRGGRTLCPARRTFDGEAKVKLETVGWLAGLLLALLFSGAYVTSCAQCEERGGAWVSTDSVQAFPLGAVCVERRR